MSEITPDTRGVALDVPPKESVTSPPLYPEDPDISVVVMLAPSPSEGAATGILAPGSAYEDCTPLWSTAVTAIVYLLFVNPSAFESSSFCNPFPAAKVYMFPNPPLAPYIRHSQLLKVSMGQDPK